MKLYFLRHGIAEDREQWTDNDEKRPLTDKGKKRMAKEGKRMKEMGIAPDLILTSPLVRAKQTAEIAAEHLSLEDKVKEDKRLAPGFAVPAVGEILREYRDADSIMLVGHEPDFSETVASLIGGGHVVCKKGGLALIELEQPDSLQGELLWLIPPSLLADDCD